MLLTRENDYAIRITRSLRDGKKHTVKDICSMEDIPEAFAYKIIRKLSKANILKVGRGMRGGCCLGQELANLTIYDVLVALDEVPVITSCLREPCSRNQGEDGCNVHMEMVRIQSILTCELKSRPLSELF